MAIVNLARSSAAVTTLGVLAAGLLPLAASDPTSLESTRIRPIISISIPSRREGVIEVVNVAVGKYVQTGDLLVRLDDRLARAELSITEAKLIAAKADLDAAIKTAGEAKDRIDSRVRSKDPAKEIQEAKRIWNRAVAAVVPKIPAVCAAMWKLKEAKAILELHEIRSPGRGTIKTVSRHPGDAVRNQETVLEIELDEQR